MEINNASNKNPDLVECPVCKGSVSKNAEHCPHCGQPLVGEKIRPNLAKCSVCNGVIALDAETCPRCGTHLHSNLPTGLFIFLCICFPLFAIVPAGIFLASSDENKRSLGKTGLAIMIIIMIIAIVVGAATVIYK